MRLTAGKGSPTTGACWMSAIHYYTRNDASWSDHPACVPPTIRALCIQLNDMCSDGEREALIGPHLFTPIGCDPSPEAEQARAFLCADRAVRAFAPIALEAKSFGEHAQALRAVAPITDRASALVGRDAAQKAADAATYAAAAANAAAYAAADAAAYAAYAAADAAAAATYAAAAAAAAAYAAYAATYAAAADAAARKNLKAELLALILECCTIGERIEVAKSCAREDVLAMLER